MCVSVRRSPALVASVGLLKGSVPSLVGSSSPLATQIKKSKSSTLIKASKFNFCFIHMTSCSDRPGCDFLFTFHSYSNAVGQAVKECLDKWCAVCEDVSLKLITFFSQGSPLPLPALPA